MNIAPKFQEIKTPLPVERPGEIHADPRSTKNHFGLSADNPDRRDPQVFPPRKGDDEAQDFLQALTTTESKTPPSSPDNAVSFYGNYQDAPSLEPDNLFVMPASDDAIADIHLPSVTQYADHIDMDMSPPARQSILTYDSASLLPGVSNSPLPPISNGKSVPTDGRLTPEITLTKGKTGDSDPDVSRTKPVDTQAAGNTTIGKIVEPQNMIITDPVVKSIAAPTETVDTRTPVDTQSHGQILKAPSLAVSPNFETNKSVQSTTVQTVGIVAPEIELSPAAPVTNTIPSGAIFLAHGQTDVAGTETTREPTLPPPFTASNMTTRFEGAPEDANVKTVKPKDINHADPLPPPLRANRDVAPTTLEDFVPILKKADVALKTSGDTIPMAVLNKVNTLQTPQSSIPQTATSQTTTSLAVPVANSVESFTPQLQEKVTWQERYSTSPITKKTEIANIPLADMPKLVTEFAAPLAPTTSPVQDSVIKAAQAVTMIASTSTSHPVIQTVAQTLVKAQETQSGISVRLDPPEMGRVFIDFQFETERGVTAIIRSEVAETAILLKDKADFFQQVLKDSGFDQINLSFEQNDQSKQKTFGFDQEEKTSTLFHTEHTDDEAPQPAHPPSHKYKLSADTEIDIKL